MTAGNGAKGGLRRPEGRIRVLVADAWPVYRRGLAQAVRMWPELELVGAVGVLEIEAEIQAGSPDVVLYGMPMVAGETAELIEQVAGSVRILLLSADPEPAVVYHAIEHGAAGFLSRSCDEREIGDAITAAARGEDAISPEIQAAYASEIALRESAAGLQLNEREQEILHLIAEELTAPEIGERLKLSSSTIKTHTHHLYTKLGVKTRAGLIIEAGRLGLLP